MMTSILDVPVPAPPCSHPFTGGPQLMNICRANNASLFLTTLNALIIANPKIGEVCSRIKPVKKPASSYDYIVVGGGTAGSVVASRLSDIPTWKVLVLEAGPDTPPVASVPTMSAMFIGSDLDWKYLTSNETTGCLGTGGSCYWPRGKNLGGTSMHNGMMYTRGHKKDYDNWVAMGNEGWSWEEVLPYYKLSENNVEMNVVDRKYHSTGGLMTIGRFPWKPAIADDILAAAAEKGHPTTDDLNGYEFTGFTVAQMMNKNGVRETTSSAFLQPFRYRRNLQVALNATVTKIIIENKRAVGVQYIQDGQLRVARAKREVIVSGGAINSPQVLLLSGIGPKKHLQSVNVSVVKDLPGVGENLHDHVSHTLSWTVDQPNEYILNEKTALEYVTFQRGPMASTGLSQLTGIIPSSHTTPDHPDLQFFFTGYKAACSVTGKVGALMDNGRRSFSASPLNLHPRSKGTIRLASNDPLAKPLIHANYLNDPVDLAILVEGIQIALLWANTTAMRKYNMTLSNTPLPACSKYPFLSNDYWGCAARQSTSPQNHQAGSCKMGPASDPMAVVDPRLRVHGIKGLRVADTSIMPQVISGNTAAPAIMIGERAAAFIKEDCGIGNTQWYKPYIHPNPYDLPWEFSASWKGY